MGSIPFCIALMLLCATSVDSQDCGREHGREHTPRVYGVPGKQGKPGLVDYGKVREMIRENEDKEAIEMRKELWRMNERIDSKLGLPEMRQLRSEMKEISGELETKIEQMNLVGKKTTGGSAEINKVHTIVDELIEKVLELSTNFSSQLEKMKKKHELDLRKAETTWTNTIAKETMKVRREMEQSCSTKINEMTEKYDSKLEKLVASLGPCDVSYLEKCYEVVRYLTRKNAYEDALRECTSRGGAAADIIDRNHYLKLTKYIRKELLVGTVERYWTGMTYDYKTRKVLLTTGQEAEFVEWGQSQPNNRPSETGIMVHVVKDENDSGNGMYDKVITWEHYGIICQIPA